MRVRARWLVAVALIVGLLPILNGVEPALAQPSPDEAPLAKNDRFGIDHISYGSQVSSPERYQLATAAGAAWNRWVAYWYDIERLRGVFDYEQYDANVESDIRHGFQLDLVLMGTPAFYATGPGTGSSSSPPRNLDQPVFADGSDMPAPGKSINPDNYWARFVNTTVQRYKGQVQHYEIWNEPDFSTFWSTGDGQEVERYVRLLKVGFLAAKAADAQARVLVGGLMYWEWTRRTGVENAWLKAFLAEINADPDADRYDHYFDILALHWYARPSDLYNRTLAAKQLLEENGIRGKPIWVNETDLGVCGDPQNAGKPDCTPGVAKGRPEEQASFILQASANAIAAGVDKLFAFQLSDDNLGPFEYYGLVRENGSARPAYAAYQVATRYFRNVDTAIKVIVPPVEAVSMVTRDGKNVTAVWNASAAPVTVAIPAHAPTAVLVDQSGKERSLVAYGGAYELALPGATFNMSASGSRPDYPVGGVTSVIVETLPPPTPTATPDPTPTRPIPPAPTTQPKPTPTPISEQKAASPEAAPVAASLASLAPPASPAPATNLAVSSPVAAAGGGVNGGVAARTRDGLLSQSDVFPVPPALSTIRVSDVSSDSFAISWVSAFPTTGIVRCGLTGPVDFTTPDVRGSETRAVTHFVILRDLRPTTSYLCSAQSGSEVEDNGGAYFRVRTLQAATPSDTNAGPRIVKGSVMDERGRARTGAIIYATLLSSVPSGASSTFATMTDEAGRFQIAVPSTQGQSESGAVPLRLSAIADSTLVAGQTPENDAAPTLKLHFTWSPYPSAAVTFDPGWNILTLPLSPVNPLTIADLTREVAAQGGRIDEVYFWENDLWQGGSPLDETPLKFGRQYAVKAATRSTWTMRGQAQ